MKAYKDGSLLLRDDNLMTYGERLTLGDRGSVVPLIDAITAQPILGDDGQPVYFPETRSLPAQFVLPVRSKRKPSAT